MLGGCLEPPQTGSAELRFCSFLHGKVTVTSLSAESSAVDFCGERFSWMGGKMSPSNTLLQCLGEKNTLAAWLLVNFPIIYLGASFKEGKKEHEPIHAFQTCKQCCFFAMCPGMGLQKVAANNVANAHPWETVTQLHSLCSWLALKCPLPPSELVLC